MSHPTLNHKPPPTSKNILTPMRIRGVVVAAMMASSATPAMD